MKSKMRWIIQPIIILLSLPCWGQEDTRLIGDPKITVFQPDTTTAINAPVGSIDGAFDVSAMGAATYSMKIDCPKGIHGMTPELAISYNSQSGNGVAGWGTNISGISAITLASKDVARDSVMRGVKYDWQDAFYLDGHRLLLQTGVYGAKNSEYTLEGDPFTKVTIKGRSGFPALWFDVTTPDGMNYRYGADGVSVLKMTIGGEQRGCVWYLNRVIDPLGNTIIYNYEQQDGYLYLTNVTYGTGEIDFTYVSRADSTRYYLGDAPCKLARRLSQITSKTGDDIYRQYNLTYNTTGDNSPVKFSRLTKVTENNGTGESLRPTNFTWSYLPGFAHQVQQPVVTLKESNDTLTIKSRCFLSGDLNGDGISDIIQITPVSLAHSGHLTDYTYVYVYTSNLLSNGSISYNTPLEYYLDPCITWNHYKSGYSGIQLVDMDGDGLNDIYLTSASIFTDHGYGNNIYAYIPGYKIKERQTRLYIQRYGWSLSNPSDIPLTTYADYDGDGRTEVVGLEAGKTNNVYKTHYVYDINEAGIQRSVFDISLTSAPKHIFSGDFNNDGLADIIIFYSGGYKVYLNKGVAHGVTPFAEDATVTGSIASGDIHICQGDFNGDGQLDFAFNVKSSNNYYFLFGQGTGSFQHILACSNGPKDETSSNTTGTLNLFAYDFNHDGRSDLFISKSHHAPNGIYQKSYFYWMNSDGSSLTQARYAMTNHKDDIKPGHILLGDFNGDGWAELMNYGSDIYTPVVTSKGDDDESDDELAEEERENSDYSIDSDIEYNDSTDIALDTRSDPDPLHIYNHQGLTSSSGRVTKIKDGFDNETNIYYTSLASGNVYQHTTGGAYPFVESVIPISVVLGTASSNGACGAAYQSYGYGGLMQHVRGRGLAGFSIRKTIDNNAGITRTDEVELWDSTYCAPLTILHSSLQGGYLEAQRDSSRIVIYPQIGNACGNFKVFPWRSTSWDIYENMTHRLYDYNDSLGYINWEKETVDDGSYRRSEYQGYVLKGKAYRPQTVTKTQKHHDDSSAFSQITTFSYNDNGLVTRKVENAQNSSLALTTDFTYDSYGNVKTEKQTGSGITQSQIYYTYKNNGRDAKTIVTYPSYVMTDYTYDTWGNVLREIEKVTLTHPDTTAYVYNGWGQLVSKTFPIGTTTWYKRGWGTTASNKYYFIEHPSGQPWSKTWYDSRGRETSMEGIGPDHSAVFTSQAYNTKGQLVQSADNDCMLMRNVAYTYDVLGRLSTEVHSTGEQSSYTYGNRQQTVVKNGQTYTKTFDAWGNVRTATDPIGSVSYTYSSTGNIATATSGGSTITVTYDAAGNKASLNDPDAGLTTYTYDPKGRVKQQTDARGNTTQFTYDGRGRLTQKTLSDDVITYTYGTANNERNRLSRMASNHASVDYAYDAYGHVIQEVRHMEYEPDLTFTYTYNSLGQLASTTYPGNVTVNYEYDDVGYKNRMLLGNEIAWRRDFYNGIKDVTYTCNNLLRHIDKFNELGLLTSQVTYRGEARVDTMSFTYDTARGNLLSRTGMYDGITETFAYDALDRLVSVSHNDTIVQSFSFAANGNITGKTGLGTYSYTSSHPHAVTGVENTNGLAGTVPQYIQYNGLNKVYRIGENFNFDDLSMLTTLKEMESRANTDSAGLENLRSEIGYSVFTYGPDEERWKMSTTEFMSGHVVQKSRIYAGDYEKLIFSYDSIQYYYIGEGLVYVKRPDYLPFLYYACTDNLGSYRKLINAMGMTPFKASYDAWGNQTLTTNTIEFRRGYTGHEMLPQFGLINMNGRLYDPHLGRFLSPDNYVQMPDFSQSFNRYSYCINNPLKFTDPDGENPLLIAAGIAAIIGGAINVAEHWDQIDNFWQGLGYFGVGALAWGGSAMLSSVSFGLGGAVGGLVSGAIQGGSAGFILGGGNALISGDSFWKNALRYSMYGAAFGGVMNGVFSGLSSWYNGNNFWTGKSINTTTTITNNNNIIPENNKSIIQSDNSTLKLASQETTSLSPVQKGQEGVNRAINEFIADGGKPIQTEVSLKIDGITYRADFIGEKDGILQIFEVKNGVHAGFTPNQRIAIPKLQNGNATIIPFGKNALNINEFRYLVPFGKPYTGSYQFNFIRYY